MSLSCSGSEDSISECNMISQPLCDIRLTRAAVQCQGQGGMVGDCIADFNNFSPKTPDAVLCDDGDLRLVGGRDSEREGNLEICFNGVWGSVCENRRDFSSKDAAVACNQLGYNPTGKLHYTVLTHLSC